MEFLRIMHFLLAFDKFLLDWNILRNQHQCNEIFEEKDYCRILVISVKMVFYFITIHFWNGKYKKWNHREKNKNF